MTTETIQTRELIDTVRRVAHEQPLYRNQTRMHLFLAAAELERLAYPSAQTGVKGSVLPTTESVGGLAALSGSCDHEWEAAGLGETCRKCHIHSSQVTIDEVGEIEAARWAELNRER